MWDERHRFWGFHLFTGTHFSGEAMSTWGSETLALKSWTLTLKPHINYFEIVSDTLNNNCCERNLFKLCEYYVCVHIYIYIYTHTYTHTHMYTHIAYIYIYIHTYIHIYIYIYIKCIYSHIFIHSFSALHRTI